MTTPAGVSSAIGANTTTSDKYGAGAVPAPTATPVALPPSPTRAVACPLFNLGNTCFMNAVLQALFHAPEMCLAIDCEPHRATCPVALEQEAKLRRALASSPDDAASALLTVASDNGEKVAPESGYEAEADWSSSSLQSDDNSSDGDDDDQKKNESSVRQEDTDDKFCALCEFEQLFRELHEKKQSSAPVAPTAFVDGIWGAWNAVKSGQQQDASEFLLFLLGAMEKSCVHARAAKWKNNNNNKGKSKENDSKISNADGEGTKRKGAGSGGISSNNNKKKNYENKNQEYPFFLFRAIDKEDMECTACGRSASSQTPYTAISLPVARHPAPCGSDLGDVKSALAELMAEDMPQDFDCPTCGAKSQTSKRWSLAAFPPILILHVMRFQESRKIGGHFGFERVFDLKPFLSNELQNKHEKVLCRLFAVVVHSGTTFKNGHYVAYVSSLADNEWWMLNDASASKVTPETVMQQEAYMLFYSVTEHPTTAKLKKQLRLKFSPDAAAATTKDATAAAQGNGGAIPNASRSPEGMVPVDGYAGTKESGPAVGGTKISPRAIPKSNAYRSPESVDGNAGTKESGPAGGGTKISPPAVTAGRKRGPSEGFDDGEDWARKRTSIPPYLCCAFRKIQERLADMAQLTEDCQQAIRVEASKDGAAARDYPAREILEVDVDCGTVNPRRRLHDLFFELAKKVEGREDPTGSCFVRGQEEL